MQKQKYSFEHFSPPTNPPKYPCKQILLLSLSLKRKIVIATKSDINDKPEVAGNVDA